MNTCATCRHAHRLETNQLTDPVGANLICRRYPPQVFTITDEVVQAWPVVEVSDVCGEHVGRPTRVPDEAPRAQTPEVGAPGRLRRH